MDKLKERSEVSASDKWQIEKIYKNIEEFNKDYTWVEESFNTLKQVVKKFLNSKEDFSAFFKFDSKISRVIEKLSVYANCKEDEDTANTTYQELSSKIQNLYAKYSEITSSVVPNIIKEDENKILSYIDEDLESYRHMITSILRQKKHCLSSDNEKLLAAFSPVLGSASDTYSYLTNADMKLGTIHDEENKEVELNESNFSRYIRSKDRRVRKESFEKLYESYAGVKNTIASLYGSILKYDSINAKLRGYTSSLESYLNPNNIPTALYNNLIKTINDNLEPLYEYFELKKKMLGLDGKEQIEEYGMEPFIKKCKESVWKYKGMWEDFSDTVGFWADMENPYITYDNNFIESVWWALKQIWDKGLLYKGFKIVPYCPRCGTPLSAQEVAQGYKDVKER